jgi:hypothetical protein
MEDFCSSPRAALQQPEESEEPACSSSPEAGAVGASPTGNDANADAGACSGEETAEAVLAYDTFDAAEAPHDWLLAQLASLQRDKNVLAARNAELARNVASLRQRCGLLESEVSRVDAAELAQERLAAQAAQAQAEAAASEARAAASEARARAAESAEAELVASLSAARLQLAQSRFEADASSLAFRKQLQHTTGDASREAEALARANARSAQLEMLLADTARANAQLARELAQRRQALEALCVLSSPTAAVRKPLAQRNA